MSNSSNPNPCPKCGASIPAEAPGGLCPRCVLAGAATATDTGLPPAATAEIPSIPRVAAAFPQLEIIELIGRGGMGYVFKARQPNLDRFVALKLLPDKLARDPRFTERFNREGRMLAKLNHPNIVSIFDFGSTEHFYFLLMEYVDGVNLRQAMQAGRFSPAEALGIVPKVCEALQYAHEQGILHRDIKPENILLDAKGRVKIADFGIAKLIGDDKPDFSLTATGAALGTPHYMAPEQLEKPTTVDHRADIYSLGVVFYEMLTGELPIGRFAAPSAKTPVGVNVDEVVFRTLEKDRERRYQSAGAMKTEVEHLTDAGAGQFKGVPVPPGGGGPKGPHGTMVVNPPATPPPLVPWSQKAIWAAVLVGISLLPVVVGLVGMAVHFGRLGGWELIGIFATVALSLPGIAGTILGWMALRDIRAKVGKLRGVPLAVFAALAWPVLVLVGATLVIPWMLAYRGVNVELTKPASMVLVLLVPAGTITFAIWAVYAAVRWGANKPATRQRGVLKLVFLGLFVAVIGVMSGLNFLRRDAARQPAKVAAEMASDSQPGVPAEPMKSTPWIRFTFTAVELREVAGVRWLAIDYVDDAHGDCQKSFPWETTIPGFKADTRMTEFVTDAKDSSPPVRHQRIEYRIPDSAPRDQLERLHDNLEKALKQKSFRLELAESQTPLLLFELPGKDGGSLKAWVKVAPPLGNPTGQPVTTVQSIIEKALEFGPVIERVVADFSAFAVDPNSSRALTLPASLLKQSPGPEKDLAICGWLERQGGDFAHLNRGVFYSSLHDMRTVERDEWDTLSPVRLAASLHSLGKSIPARFGDKNPFTYTFGFQTREGRLGLLQLVGYTNNPSGVKIRYKLAQRVSATPDTDQEKKMVIDALPIEQPPGAKPPPDGFHWGFKSLIPPEHLARILFVRWSNGVPSIIAGQSAYHKVGKTPAEVDLFVSFDKHHAPQPVNERSQWTASLGTGFSASTFQPVDPPYLFIPPSGRMTVRSGHQRSIPLIEFFTGDNSNPSNGIDLRLILQPLKGSATRSVPTEKDHGNYVSGSGLAGTMEETLRDLRELPIDP